MMEGNKKYKIQLSTIGNEQLENEVKRECEEYGEFNSIKTVNNKINRIIALGDIHGDMELAKQLLKMSHVIDDDNKWIGGETYVVQVGDQIDSYRPPKPKTKDKECANDLTVLNFFTELHKKAQKAGGAVISLIGNHELMNVLGDMRYVSHNNVTCFSEHDNYEHGLIERKKHFEVGNKYAKYLGCTRLSAIIINDILFVHAGILPDFVKKLNLKTRNDLEIFNNVIKLWLIGKVKSKDIKKLITNDKSLFWNRLYGNIEPNAPMEENESCSSNFKPIMKYFDIGHMIIGHSPQSIIHNMHINSTCDNKIWRVDAGSSYAFDIAFNKKYRNPQVLEILTNEFDEKIFKIIQ